MARITPTGDVTEVPLPASQELPFGITIGPDGNLWFTEISGAVGRITRSGKITVFPTGFWGPSSITAGPDGNLWFTGQDTNRIWRITPSGQIRSFRIPGFYQSAWITSGPDGNLWFSQSTSPGFIWRMSPTGEAIKFPVSQQPMGITAGPDGNLWFTEWSTMIGRITPQGVVTEFNTPTLYGYPTGIAAGSDGHIWFTEDVGEIGRMDPWTEVIEDIPTPTEDSHPSAMAAGPDGNIWFMETGVDQIGRVDLGQSR